MCAYVLYVCHHAMYLIVRVWISCQSSRVELNKKHMYCLSPFASENLVSRERLDRPAVPCQPAHSPHSPQYKR